MTYPSQQVATKYFVMSAVLFLLQVVVGLLLIAKFVWPDPLIGLFPFNVARSVHTNLLVVWMLMGFMGATYYLVPEESRRDLFSTRIANVQFWLLSLIGVAGVTGFLFGWTAGKPLLELPLPLKLAVVVVALMFIFNVAMTIAKGDNRTVVQGVLLGGIVMLSATWLIGLPTYRNLTVDYYYFWWLIHLWVEGAWELIAIALTAYILLKTTSVERKLIDKWLYVEVALILVTGIIGIGHHYYWIGTPKYWLWWGGLFSALEPLPILLMVTMTINQVRRGRAEVKNRLVYYWAIGCSIFHFFGAGVLGFIIGLPNINKWVHGSGATTFHGHLAFFGAYAMIILTFAYYAMPRLSGGEAQQGRGFWVFWTTMISMLVIGFSFGFAGVVEGYLHRFLDVDFLTVQEYARPWFLTVFISGLFFLAGVALYLFDIAGIVRRGGRSSLH